MPRPSEVSPETADPDTRQIFDAFLKERGNIPNMFRTVAHRAEIMKTMTAHFRTVVNPITGDKGLK